MFVLGLGHKARHGKDTFANAVVEAFPSLDIRLASFADPLRLEVREAAIEVFEHKFPGYPFNPQMALRILCSYHHVEFDPNAVPDADYPWGKQRRLHQWWGTEYRRAQNPHYWTDKGEQLILKARAAGADALVFRDMRFHNEYDLIGDVGGWRQKVSRLGYVSDVPEHISETELDDRPFDGHLGVKDGELQLLKDLSVVTFKRLLEL